MAAAGRYIDADDCYQRMSQRLVVYIFDDDNDGTIESGTEESAFQDCILDAESEIEDAIQKTYGPSGLEWLRGLDPDDPDEFPRTVKRLCLDAFEVRAMRRHPQYIRSEWMERERAITAALERIRIREREIAHVDEPEARNEGGEVLSGNPGCPTPRPKAFLDGTGLW